MAIESAPKLQKLQQRRRKMEEAVANAQGLGPAVFCTAVCAALVVSVCIPVSA